jgi:hypothetical protein
MQTIDQLFANGRIVDLMIALLAVEAAAILIYRRWRGGGIAPAALLTNFGAGLSLMLALRAGLTGAGTQQLALCLAGALVFHVADLAVRWGRGSPPSPGPGTS